MAGGATALLVEGLRSVPGDSAGSFAVLVGLGLWFGCSCCWRRRWRSATVAASTEAHSPEPGGIFGDDFCISLYGPRRHLGLDVGEPLFKEARHRQPRWLDGSAALQLC